MEAIKTQLRTLITNSKKPRSARDDLDWELRVVQMVINGVLVRPNYNGTSPEKKEIKELVQKAEAIDPKQTITELTPLVKEFANVKNPSRRKTTKAGRKLRKTQKYSRRR